MHPRGMYISLKVMVQCYAHAILWAMYSSCMEEEESYRLMKVLEDMCTADLRLCYGKLAHSANVHAEPSSSYLQGSPEHNYNSD